VRRLRAPAHQDLQAAYDAGTLRLVGALEALRHRPAWMRALAALRQTEWVVYAKRPFAGPQQVVEYVGRYTHRVAISNRLLDMDDGEVRFTYKDYRADPPDSPKTMTLTAPRNSSPVSPPRPATRVPPHSL
jgi:hypothetical protein